MLNILIDKTAVQDLILSDREIILVRPMQGCYQEGPMSIIKTFFDIEWFKTRTQKFVYFLADGVSVSIVLGEESQPNQTEEEKGRGR